MSALTALDARKKKTALYSLCGAVGVCAVVLAGWWAFKPGEIAQAALQRQVTDGPVWWKCSEGHRFKEKGAYKTPPCPQCGRSSEMAADYVCPEHGDWPALIRVVLVDGKERLKEVSLRRGVWTPVHTGVYCPDCGRKMSPKSDAPFVLDRTL